MEIVKRLFSNTEVINNQHGMAGRGTQSPITVLVICLALTVPGLAIAKKAKPVKPEPSPIPECIILINDVVYTGNPYTAKLVRDPRYPDAWRNPTITIEASYTGSDITGMATYEPGLFNVTYVNASFVVPGDASFGGTANLTATVREPLKKRNTFRETNCTASAGIQ